MNITLISQLHIFNVFADLPAANQSLSAGASKQPQAAAAAAAAAGPANDADADLEARLNNLRRQ